MSLAELLRLKAKLLRLIPEESTVDRNEQVELITHAIAKARR